MWILIDVSIFVGEEAAFGRLSGRLDLVAVPHMGSYISFEFPPIAPGCSFPTGFSGQVKISSVVFRPNCDGEQQVLLMLEDIVIDSLEEAHALVGYLETGFRLNADVY